MALVGVFQNGRQQSRARHFHQHARRSSGACQHACEHGYCRAEVNADTEEWNTNPCRELVERTRSLTQHGCDTAKANHFGVRAQHEEHSTLNCGLKYGAIAETDCASASIGPRAAVRRP